MYNWVCSRFATWDTWHLWVCTWLTQSYLCTCPTEVTTVTRGTVRSTKQATHWKVHYSIRTDVWCGVAISRTHKIIKSLGTQLETSHIILVPVDKMSFPPPVSPPRLCRQNVSTPTPSISTWRMSPLAKSTCQRHSALKICTCTQSVVN